MINVNLWHGELLKYTERLSFIDIHFCPIFLANPYFIKVHVTLGWLGMEA